MLIYFENTQIPLISQKKLLKTKIKKLLLNITICPVEKFKQCRDHKVTLSEVSSQPISTNYLHHRNNRYQRLVDIIHILYTICKHI